jgi:hypothetical protein
MTAAQVVLATNWEGRQHAVALRSGQSLLRTLKYDGGLEQLAASTPRTLWAATGIRAVYHAIETTYARSDAGDVGARLGCAQHAAA